MKKHLSVWMLGAKMTLWPALLIIIVMLAAQTTLFAIALRGYQGASAYPLPEILSSRFAPLSAIGLLLTCLVLAVPGFRVAGVYTGYTMLRLRIHPRTAVCWWALQTALVLLIFWAMQLVTAVLLLRYGFCIVGPSALTEQAFFLSFYENTYLHTLLPLADVSRWVCNITLILAFSATCTTHRAKSSSGLYLSTGALWGILLIACLRGTIESHTSNILITLAALCIMLYHIYLLWRWDCED